jgi:osmoprotectant transport system substrate-binding protein
MKKNSVILIIILILSVTFLSLPKNMEACVGKTIVIGAKDSSTVQRIIDEILALLINERTGTSVKLVNFNTPKDCREAIISAEVDIYVEYTGSALTEVLMITDVKDKESVFEIVKNKYNEKFNLIWLAPYGFDYQEGLKEEYKDKGIPAVAAPIVRKDTLKKFPALARLLKKLSGKISNEKLDELVKKVTGDNFKEVARQFLKDNRLI